jgi:Leucine-rich repeat (LRR) protein
MLNAMTSAGWARIGRDEQGVTTRLSARGRGLSVSPVLEPGERGGLRSVDLSFNAISDLPAELKSAPLLTELRLDGNGLTTIPDLVLELSQLELG